MAIECFNTKSGGGGGLFSSIPKEIPIPRVLTGDLKSILEKENVTSAGLETGCPGETRLQT